MPVIHPLAASGSRDLETPKAVPKAVRDALVLMVRGRPDDPDGRPLDFIAAGKVCGIKPDVMRRWLDRPEVIKLLRAERRVYREAVCSGNEGALARVRDTSENGMCVVHAVRTLENSSRRGGGTPGADAIARLCDPDRDWLTSGRAAQVRPRSVVTITLSADHRVSDGHAGALFLAEIGKLLQEPDKL